MNATATIVSKVWSFCTTLRDDGVGYGDYLEQLTYLIFLAAKERDLVFFSWRIARRSFARPCAPIARCCAIPSSVN